MNVGELAQRGIRVHTMKGYGDTAVAEHAIALMLAVWTDISRLDLEVRSSMHMVDARRRAALWQDPRRHRAGRYRPRGSAHRPRAGDAGDCVESHAAPRRSFGRARRTAYSLRRDFAAPRAQRRHPRISRGSAGGAHEAWRDPHQSGAYEDAAIDGLRSGRIRHAGLDVFHAEPLRPDHPIAAMDNVTLTAHAGFRTLEASMTLLRRAIEL